MEGMITACVEGEPVRWRIRRSKKNFAIWTKTFKFDRLAIPFYRVEILYQMVMKGVKKLYPVSTAAIRQMEGMVTPCF